MLSLCYSSQKAPKSASSVSSVPQQSSVNPIASIGEPKIAKSMTQSKTPTSSTRLAKPYQHQAVVDLTVGMLNRWMEKPHAPDSAALKEFSRYVRWVLDRSNCPSECLPVALCYLQRVLEQPGCTMTSNNLHSLFIAAFMMASKWLEDCVLYTKDWAEVSGFDVKLLIRMERDMLRLLDWKVTVSHDQYLEMIHDSRKTLSIGA